MPASDPPTPSYFFRRFKAKFKAEHGRRKSELRQTHDRFMERKRIKDRSKESKVAYSAYSESLEWTAIMSLFLSGLARDIRYRQEWERLGRVDYVWYDGRTTEDPAVLIEHEQQRYEKLSHLDKLRRVSSRFNNHPLCVVVAYEWSNYDAETLRKKVQSGLRKGRRSFSGRFLLIIGDRRDWIEDVTDPYPWIAFEWRRPSLTLLGKTTGWDRSHS